MVEYRLAQTCCSIAGKELGIEMRTAISQNAKSGSLGVGAVREISNSNCSSFVPERQAVIF